MLDLAVTVGGFLVMGLLCLLLERVWPVDQDQPVWRADSMTDVLYFLLRIGLSAVLVLAMGLTGSHLPQQGKTIVGSQPIWLQVFQVMFLSDLIQYWSHRIMHEYAPLWRLHAVHHSPEQIDWLVAARVHPCELVINKVVSTVPLYFLGFAPEAFAIAVPLVASYSLLLHANVSWSYGPAGYLVASPAFHRWHHSSDPEARDKNYAQVFPLLDFLFGTAYFPPGHPEKYGLVKGKMPHGIWGQFLHPFRSNAGNYETATPSNPKPLAATGELDGLVPSPPADSLAPARSPLADLAAKK